MKNKGGPCRPSFFCPSCRQDSGCDGRRYRYGAACPPFRTGKRASRPISYPKRASPSFRNSRPRSFFRPTPRSPPRLCAARTISRPPSAARATSSPTTISSRFGRAKAGNGKASSFMRARAAKSRNPSSTWRSVRSAPTPTASTSTGSASHSPAPRLPSRHCRDAIALRTSRRLELAPRGNLVAGFRFSAFGRKSPEEDIQFVGDQGACAAGDIKS